MLKNNSFMTIGYLFLFFPSINFKIIPADIFFWAVLFLPVLTSIIFSIKLIFFISSIFILNISLALLISPHYHPTLIDVLWSSGAILNCICGLCIGLKLKIENIPKLRKALKIVLLIWAIFTIAFLFKIELFREFWGFFVRRGGHFINNFDFGSRGLSLTSPEPARSAILIVSLKWIIGFLYYKDKVRDLHRYLIFLFLIFLFLVFLNRSASGLLLFSIFLILFFGSKANLKFIFIIFSLLSLTFIIFLLIPNSLDYFMFSSGRGVQLLRRMFLDNPLDSIMSFSGSRLTNLYLSYISISFFGSGIGNVLNQLTLVIPDNLWLFEYNNKYYNKFGINELGMPRAERPFSFFALFLLECGIFFSSIILFIIFYICRKSIRLPNNFRELLWLLFPIFGIFFYGSSGLPIYSFCIGLALNRELFLNFKKG